MLDILPPLFMRADMFAMREFMTGSVTSIFFALAIDGRRRWFHGYCDLSDRLSPERMKAAIIERESRPVRAMTRDERLEHIWSSTHDDYRGYAGERWPHARPPHRTRLCRPERHSPEAARRPHRGRDRGQAAGAVPSSAGHGRGLADLPPPRGSPAPRASHFSNRPGAGPLINSRNAVPSVSARAGGRPRAPQLENISHGA
ncbi:hypothetical protein ABIF38_000020 [Bradyrhizobium japonicum]|nr:hypothetical protein [Bradyrhizobium elkanii]MCS3594584.1 hypothetical protein [Bradyrhizobium elkanii]MCS3625777.1 hypothetical protein [Bradyrhizobium elkanii]